jgi:hypothetical protein
VCSFVLFVAALRRGLASKRMVKRSASAVLGKAAQHRPQQACWGTWGENVLSLIDDLSYRF